MRQPWEQLDNEPDEAYTRFLFYRNQGPTRSLDGAYQAYCYSADAAQDSSGQRSLAKATKRAKSQQASGKWGEDSSKYNWVHRAVQWDISILQASGQEFIINFYKALAVHQNILLDAIRPGPGKPEIKPRTYGEWLAGMEAVGNYISPEAVSAWRDVADNTGPSEETSTEPE